VIALAAKPTKKGAFQEPGVETVGFGTAVLTRHGDARGMDDVRLNAVCLQPPR
jgi:hypothetical protein